MTEPPEGLSLLPRRLVMFKLGSEVAALGAHGVLIHGVLTAKVHTLQPPFRPVVVAAFCACALPALAQSRQHYESPENSWISFVSESDPSRLGCLCPLS